MQYSYFSYYTTNPANILYVFIMYHFDRVGMSFWVIF